MLNVGSGGSAKHALNGAFAVKWIFSLKPADLYSLTRYNPIDTDYNHQICSNNGEKDIKTKVERMRMLKLHSWSAND